MIVTGAGMDFEEGNVTVEGVWCDIETQKFYCELQELKAFLPTSYINNVPDPAPVDSVTEEVLDSELPVDELEDDGNFFYIKTKLDSIVIFRKE